LTTKLLIIAKPVLYTVMLMFISSKYSIGSSVVRDGNAGDAAAPLSKKFCEKIG